MRASILFLFLLSTASFLFCNVTSFLHESWLARVEGVDPGKTPVVTSIGDERTFNAFFRLDNGEIQASLELTEASDREVFLALRAQRNHW